MTSDLNDSNNDKGTGVDKSEDKKQDTEYEPKEEMTVKIMMRRCQCMIVKLKFRRKYASIIDLSQFKGRGKKS